MRSSSAAGEGLAAPKLGRGGSGDLGRLMMINGDLPSGNIWLIYG